MLPRDPAAPRGGPPAAPPDAGAARRAALRPTGLDIILLSALTILNVVVAVINGTNGDGHARFGPWAGLGLQLVVVVALVVRRVWPLVVLGV
ncbi:hypothetical protein ACFYQ5_35715, partial [Streptomyces sp. NPDC005794]|uniref:hypothetical protein n=1 Tax=Streptomyces sp. NPDC005794 TaxID=3364733 RepID=UPI003695E1B5